MNLFRDITIQRKLMLIIMLTTMAALFLAATTFLIYEWFLFRRTMVNDLATLAKITASNSTAALAFQDQKSAEEILSALSAEDDVIRAAIYRKDGKVFASYFKTDSLRQSSLPAAETGGHRFQQDHLELFRPIILDNEILGVVYLQSSLERLYDRLRLYVFIVLVGLLLSSLAAFVLSSKLQRLISEPILNLAKIARTVSVNKNYTVRAEKQSRDELGVLVEGFNEMLAEIQLRDSALQQAYEEMEERVRERTKDLQQEIHERTKVEGALRKSELEIRKLNVDLEQRVTERTAELQAANQELEAFSYSVSHDLRAPLRKIDGFSQALLEDYTDKLDETAKDYLRRTRAASQHLAVLIDDMLNLSRVTRTEMLREEFDLGVLAKSIVEEFQQNQPARSVTFKIDEGLIVNGDTHLLRILLENLLGNAWKFTAKHELATIEFGAISNNGKPVYFVRDDGAGFDMTYSEKLFGPFQRLHSIKEFDGTGIGLATVKRIIQRHGGSVWAESAIEKGATFYFTL